ncbi:hypothetical protein C8Q75DRAFT_811813 [Abortiporus biennis]|nr:hypothetical protein C8Q75DRAFT_811813 [Abortiporus biennis]
MSSLNPLALLPADLADQLENSRYIVAATVGAITWDILMSVRDEYKIVRLTKRVRPTDIVYVISRCMAYIQIMLSFLLIAGKIENCSVVLATTTWMAVVVIALNCLFFLFRINAVFYGHRLVIAFFVCLWLTAVALSVYSAATVPSGSAAIRLGSVTLCLPTEVSVGARTSIGLIAAAVHDTLVWLAISLKLILLTWGPKSPSAKPFSLKGIFAGSGMGKITGTLFIGGQVYYFVAVATNIFAIVIMLTPSIPDTYKRVPQVVNIALQNAMACRVYRELKLGVITDPMSVPSPPGVVHIHQSTITNADSTFGSLPRSSTTRTMSPIQIFKTQSTKTDRDISDDVELGGVMKAETFGGDVV